MTVARERVCVRGDPNQIDSLTACLVAVLDVWGHPVGYDWVAGLAGIAFSPVLDPDEECTAWWMEAGSEARMCFLGHALGFTVERVTREATWDDAARETYAQTGLLPEPHEQHFARLRAALDRGDAVVMRTWPAWSVLVGWDRDLDQLPFATVPGFEDLVQQIWGPAKAQLAYVLNPIAPSLDLERSVSATLQFGARVAAGHGPEENLRYGPALYTEAAERMGESVFCPSCQSHGDSCAHRTLMRMLGTQRSAARFLEDASAVIAWDLPWQAAIDRYRAMADITSTYCGWQPFHDAWERSGFREGLRDDFRALAELQGEAARALADLAKAYERELA